jgi:hypothetical protein
MCKSSLRENDAETFAEGQKVLHSFRKIGIVKLFKNSILPNVLIKFLSNMRK